MAHQVIKTKKSDIGYRPQGVWWDSTGISLPAVSKQEQEEAPKSDSELVLISRVTPELSVQVGTLQRAKGVR